MSHNCIPTITLPTRINDQSYSLIDNIFIKMPNDLLGNKVLSGNLCTDISDHLSNFCVIQGTKEHTKGDRPMITFYNQTNFSNFIEAIEAADLKSVYNSHDVNTSYNQLLDILNHNHNLYFPLSRMSRKKLNDKPWITPGIKKSISHKNILYRKYINNPTHNHKINLTSYRNVLNRIIRSAQSYYHNYHQQYTYSV